MGEDLLLKAKYQQLRNELYSIKNQLNGLQTLADDVTNALKSSLLIDNKVVDEELFNTAKKDLNSVSNELSGTVIPLVNNKC